MPDFESIATKSVDEPLSKIAKCNTTSRTIEQHIEKQQRNVNEIEASNEVFCVHLRHERRFFFFLSKCINVTHETVNHFLAT